MADIDGLIMEIEGLEKALQMDPQKDVETQEAWAKRNGMTEDTVEKWVQRGYLPSVKIGKRRMINCIKLRQLLLEEE